MSDDTRADAQGPSRRPSRSVVVPIYDESADGLRSFVDRLLSDAVDEVVLAPDGAEGGLADAVSDLAARAAVRVSASERRRGKGGAVVDGLARARGETIGYVDADGAVPVDDLARLYAVVDGDSRERSDPDGGTARDGVADARCDRVDCRGLASETAIDVAVGSRTAGDGRRSGQSVGRRLLGRGYGWLAGRLTAVPVADPQCGATVLDRTAWEAVPSPRTTGYAFDTELLAWLHHRGFEIAERPVDWRDPGDSTVSPLRDVPEMVGDLVRVRRALSGDAATPSNGGATADEGAGATARDRRSGSIPSVTDDEPLELALVSAHPPNRGHLAEYGEELATAYAVRDDVRVTVLAREDADTAGTADPDRPYPVERCWTRDSPRSALGLLRTLAGGEYDAVQFNVHMTYFGQANHNRFLGLALPALTRAAGVPTVTTLHDLLEVLEEDVREETVGPIERVGARAATQVALLGSATTVTAADYERTVRERYRPGRLEHVPHGTFLRADGGRSALDGPFRVLVFGHLGPTKDVETVVEAFPAVREAVPDAELVIAGGSHPDYDGYRERLERRFGDRPGVRFTGYVPEAEVPDVWDDASVVILPYTTCTGVSGVYQLAKAHGRPAVIYDTDSMRTATVETGGDARFVDPGDPGSLADALVGLADDRDRLRALADANAAAGRDQTMADTADRFVDLLEEVTA